jgi:hypothetical protein
MNAITTRRIPTVLLASFSLLTALPSAFCQTESDASAVIPIIQLDNVPLPMAIENLARQDGMNFILDPALAVSSSVVNLKLENVTAGQALQKLLREQNLFLVKSAASTVTRISVTNQITTPVDANWVRAETNAVVPLMQFSHAPLDVALARLGASANLELDIDPGLSRPVFTPGKPFKPPEMVSFRWENLTPRQAFAAVCENYELILSADSATGRVQIRQLPDSTNQPGDNSKPDKKQP